MESGDGSVLGEPSVSSADSTKRRIPDSVVTKTAAPNAKRGKFANRAHKAGWLTGTPPATPSPVSSQGWHERGRVKRGANRGGGRWTPRWSRRGHYGRRPWWIGAPKISSEKTIFSSKCSSCFLSGVRLPRFVTFSYGLVGLLSSLCGKGWDKSIISFFKEKSKGMYENECSRHNWSKVLCPMCFFNVFFHLPTDDILSTAGRFFLFFFTHVGFFRRWPSPERFLSPAIE